jgi:hypothetical protein
VIVNSSSERTNSDSDNSSNNIGGSSSSSSSSEISTIAESQKVKGLSYLYIDNKYDVTTGLLWCGNTRSLSLKSIKWFKNNFTEGQTDGRRGGRN